MSIDVVVFDLDGVLLDSVPALERAYAAFAREQGFAPTPTEFARLNGPHLREIVAYLRLAHALPGSEAELLESYVAQVQGSHALAELMPHCRELLERLRELSIPLALASSAPCTMITDALRRHRLQEFFSVVASGDEVAHAKPAPDIYRRVREQFPQAESFCVVEDSAQGVAAARAADMQVIRLLGSGTTPNAAEHRTPGVIEAVDLRDVLRCLASLDQGCRWIASAEHVEVRIDPAPLSISAELEQAVAALWREQLALRPQLTDGRLLSYRAHHHRGEVLVIEASVASFRYFVAALQRPEWRVPVAPLGVSGIARDPHGRVLMAERGAVTQYQGYLELVPSGGIDERHQQPSGADPVAQLLEEWEEEVGLPRNGIARVRPLGLIVAPDGFVHDICFQLELVAELELHDCQLSAEYVNPVIDSPRALLEAAQLPPMVPVSRALLMIVAGS